jgi:hypothetical protein
MGADQGGDAMTDLTPRQLVEAITRSLKATARRMAAKYMSAVADQPASPARVQQRERHGQTSRKHSVEIAAADLNWRSITACARAADKDSPRAAAHPRIGGAGQTFPRFVPGYLHISRLVAIGRDRRGAAFGKLRLRTIFLPLRVSLMPSLSKHAQCQMPSVVGSRCFGKETAVLGNDSSAGMSRGRPSTGSG